MPQLIQPDPSLTHKQLAETYAGCIIVFKHFRGRIVGYSSRELLVDVVEGSRRYGWLLDLDRRMMDIGESLVVDEKVFERAWWCGGYGGWDEDGRKDIVGIEIDTPSIIKSPYRNKCLTCLSPSMKTAGYTLCSNLKCKSRHQFKSKMKAIAASKHISCCGVAPDFIWREWHKDKSGNATGGFKCSLCEHEYTIELRERMTWRSFTWSGLKGFVDNER